MDSSAKIAAMVAAKRAKRAMPNLSRNFAGSQDGKVKAVKKPRRAEKVEALTTKKSRRKETVEALTKNGANPLVTAAAPSLAIRAVRVSGHVGKQSGKMGVYALDTRQLTRGTRRSAG